MHSNELKWPAAAAIDKAAATDTSGPIHATARGTNDNAMPALFPRWTNVVARGTLVAVAVIGVGVPAALMLWVRTSFATGEHATVAQPVPFDHRIHAHALRIDCRYCHATAEQAASAGLPPTSACVGCHNAVWLASAPFAPVRASLTSGRPIAWQRVNALPDFVFFNHSIHVAKGVGCETCHGRVDQMARVEQVTPMSMGWCLSCHRDPAPHLRPLTEITTMGWDAAHPQSGARARNDTASLGMPATVITNCSTCHR